MDGEILDFKKKLSTNIMQMKLTEWSSRIWLKV